MLRPAAAPVSQRSINSIFISAITALTFSALPSLAYADGPAVSAINGKLSIEGGEINAHPAGIAIGSITAPLGFDFGGQADLGVGTSQGKRIWGVGGQLFARDPGIGLVGALASYNDRGVKRVTTASTITAANSGRVGAEAAYYWHQFTPELQVGYQQTSFKSGAFVRAAVNFYPIDDLALTAGGDFNPGKSFALLGVEYRPNIGGISGLTTFGEGGISGQRASYALFGVRYYFGADKTLIRRHREDDPPNLISGPGVAPTYGGNSAGNSSGIPGSGSGGGGGFGT